MEKNMPLTLIRETFHIVSALTFFALIEYVRKNNERIDKKKNNIKICQH